MKNKTSRLRAAAIVTIAGAAVLAFSACAEAPSSATSSTAASNPLPSQPVVGSVPESDLVSPGTLTLCTDAGTAPDEFYDSNGVLLGHDIDEGTAIAARLGLKVRWVDSVFDTIIVAANTGKCDAIISGQNITAERVKAIDMVPYFTGGDSLVVKKGAEDQVKGPEDLCGQKVATVLGSTEADIVKQWSADCAKAGKPEISSSLVPKQTTALQQVQTGLVTAMLFDSDFSAYFVQQHPNEFAITGSLVAGKPQGISVPKTKPELKAAIKKALLSMKDDGTLTEIRTKWGVQNKPFPDINYNPAA